MIVSTVVETVYAAGPAVLTVRNNGDTEIATLWLQQGDVTIELNQLSLGALVECVQRYVHRMPATT